MTRPDDADRLCAALRRGANNVRADGESRFEAQAQAVLESSWLADRLAQAWEIGRADGHHEQRPVNAFGNTEPARNPFRMTPATFAPTTPTTKETDHA